MVENTYRASKTVYAKKNLIKETSVRSNTVNVYFEMLDPKTIFGSVGRCGGGYNTVWADWSDEGRKAREDIMREYEEGLDQICGHYKKLESSILAEGFRSPLIISCGHLRYRQPVHLPPEIRSLDQELRLVLEGVTGGSRLWVAQKHNIPVPCLINDSTRRFNSSKKISSVNEALEYYKDSSAILRLDNFGISETYNNKATGYHMGTEWSEERIVKQRAPLWVSIMNKYGYYVDRLQPFVLTILKEAGVDQPANLKKSIRNI